MSSKRPAWVDDLEALLRKVGACWRRRTRALKRVARFKTYREAWDAEEDWNDMRYLTSILCGRRRQRQWGNAAKTREYWKARYRLFEDGPLRTQKAFSKARCELYRKFWPNPPKLPKAKPIKKGR